MRLTEFERISILRALKEDLENWRGQVFLFGSRIHDARKGGDIDLLIVLPADCLAEAKNKKVVLTDHIHELIGEQRIDFTFATREMIVSDPFLQSIWDQKVDLAGIAQRGS